MVPIISFIGYQNSGKTTIATKVVEILRKKGYKVAVLKSTKHKNVIKDTEGKDSYKYKEARADAVAIVTPEELILFQKIGEIDLKYLSFLPFDDYDIVICEGFKHSDVPKFEVTRKELNQPILVGQVKNIIGVISDYEIKGVKNFSINKPEEVAEFIEETFIAKKEDQFSDEVELFVNGKRVPIKHYVRETLREILFGFVKLLKDIEYPIKKMDIRIVVDRGEKKRTP
ncbi:molybdopterin-guanine dinucleotide biosynthesis protein B [Desulfurobacterium thermolithotrophum DSM 11699]|uniref:Molybdopterin-guanine dinucleotide biosynthesis protein B n=1 Tax=Desulfurobacterium thermolithotrophum (strain DSM 11699 / BSA) TaxID=868864 RepID=F0S3P6_DESTD|nr:molybdopterin-guanine dinucleotide biosynthesis protein B [Desulfurobacterium thermolithotrophum]ADY73468.1 molybdopterin-guanine dinucleotide biosynthesis protein B [Desulfurobacterium thermolithotrophum DSM 11699]